MEHHSSLKQRFETIWICGTTQRSLPIGQIASQVYHKHEHSKDHQSITILSAASGLVSSIQPQEPIQEKTGEHCHWAHAHAQDCSHSQAEGTMAAGEEEVDNTPEVRIHGREHHRHWVAALTQSHTGKPRKSITSIMKEKLIEKAQQDAE